MDNIEVGSYYKVLMNFSTKDNWYYKDAIVEILSEESYGFAGWYIPDGRGEPLHILITNPRMFSMNTTKTNPEGITNYEGFIAHTSVKLEEVTQTIREAQKAERLLTWKSRLTKEQYYDYLNRDLQPFDPLDRNDIIASREWRYYFDVGTLVKLDFDLMDDREREMFKDLEGVHGVITKCYSDLHAFCCGSSYQHEIRFENSVRSPQTPVRYNAHTFAPEGRVPTYLIIGLDEEELKYYEEAFKNRTPYEKLWWYIDG